MSKVICQVCGFASHDLRPHFADGKAPTCSVSAKEYASIHPNARVTSLLFDQKLAEIRGKQEAVGGELTLMEYDPKKLFGVDMGSMKVMGFVERTQWVPDINPDYIFPPEATRAVLLGLMTNRPTMLHGPTGSGKSDLILQVAARLNYPVFRQNHRADMYSHDIVGQMKVKGGETTFNYGGLPMAMTRAMIYLADEWDFITPEIAAVYQPVLERKNGGSSLGSLIIADNGAEKIDAHPLFRVFATSNTCGLGDEKGHYQGTQLQNLAFVSRFLLRVKLDYLSPDHEGQVLKKKFPALEKKEIDAMTKMASKIRERYSAGELNVPYSLRDLINFADLYILIGNAQKAMEFSCTSILPFSDSKVIEELVQRNFP